jgi:hypothetical protein
MFARQYLFFGLNRYSQPAMAVNDSCIPQSQIKNVFKSS